MTIEWLSRLVCVKLCVALLCSSLTSLGLVPFVEFPVPLGCVMSTGVSDQVNFVNSLVVVLQFILNKFFLSPSGWEAKEVNNKVSTYYFHVKFMSNQLTFSYCQIANSPNKDKLNDHEDFSSWIHPFVIPMATLGRDFFMGQLYNFVNHTIVTGTMTITIPWYME